EALLSADVLDVEAESVPPAPVITPPWPVPPCPAPPAPPVLPAPAQAALKTRMQGQKASTRERATDMVFLSLLLYEMAVLRRTIFAEPRRGRLLAAQSWRSQALGARAWLFTQELFHGPTSFGSSTASSSLPSPAAPRHGLRFAGVAPARPAGPGRRDWG